MFTARLPFLVFFLSIICIAPQMAFSFDEPIPALPSAPQDIIEKAASDTHFYMYTHERSAHTNGAHRAGKTFLLAMSCHSGNTAGEETLLGQIRHNLKGDYCLVAAGGYGSQHERIFTASCVVIKNTPHLWAKFTDAEKHKMDLLVKAGVVASAYTTSDVGAADKVKNTDLLGWVNHSRTWNPNFREAMIGMMITGTIWFGSDAAIYDFLDNYDHEKFCQQLKDAELTNTYKTFTTYLTDPKAPSPEKLQHDIKNYTIHGRRLDDLMGIYHKLTLHTYNGHVTAGLNDGEGFKGAGKIASGADKLPNKGALGMLSEFTTVDAGGPRSSIGYAYIGFRPNLIHQCLLIISGNWERGKLADECIERMEIGIEDLFYKLEHGYYDYYRTIADKKPITLNDEGRDFIFMRSLWYDVVYKYYTDQLTCAIAEVNVSPAGNDKSGILLNLSAEKSIAAAKNTITNYKWLNANSKVLICGKNAEIILPQAPQKIMLEVTDSSGRTSADTVNFEVGSNPLQDK